MSEYRGGSRSKGPIIAVAIVVVAILLAVSLFLLLNQEEEKAPASTSTGNVISSAPSDLIALAEKNETGDVRFVIGNMFPGDRESKHIYIGIEDDGVKALCFGVNIASETKSFSEVMGISVAADGVTLYDGILKDMPQFLRVEFSEAPEEVNYEIALYLDTSVGNDYQGASLAVDFDWWVADSDYVAPPSGDASGDTDKEPEKPTLTIDLSDGDKCVPWCVGLCPWCAVIPFAGLAAVALIVALVLLFKKRSKKQEEKVQKKKVAVPPAETPAAAPPAKQQGSGGIGWAVLFGALSIGSSMALNSIMKTAHKIKKPKNNNNKKKK